MMQCARRERSRRARLEAARRRLEDNPRGSWAWIWQIRVKVLQYVLAVYGEEEPSVISRSTPSDTPFLVRLEPGRGSDGLKSRAKIRGLVRDIAFLHRFPHLVQSELRQRYIDGDFTADDRYLRSISKKR